MATLPFVRTVVLGPRPAELDALIARRHALGQERTIALFVLDDGEYRRVDVSELLGVSVAQLHSEITWP